MTAAETYLPPKQAAEKIGVSPATLQRWRSEGGGPPYCKVGRRLVAYPESGFQKWLTERMASSTADAKQRGLV